MKVLWSRGLKISCDATLVTPWGEKQGIPGEFADYSLIWILFLEQQFNYSTVTRIPIIFTGQKLPRGGGTGARNKHLFYTKVLYKGQRYIFVFVF